MSKASLYRAIGRAVRAENIHSAKKDFFKSSKGHNILKKLKRCYNVNTHDEVEVGDSILDKMLSKSSYKKEIKAIRDVFGLVNRPIIYAFATKKVPDAIKVGFTFRYYKRIEEWKQIYGEDGFVVIGHWDASLFMGGTEYFIRDESVHNVIEKDRHFKNLAKEEFAENVPVCTEFFRTINDCGEYLDESALTEVVGIIRDSVLNGERKYSYFEIKEKVTEEVEPKIEDFAARDNQLEAVNNAVDAHKRGIKKTLLAAVMRYGKTHASLLISKAIHSRVTTVLTAKTDVRGEWRKAIFHKDLYSKTVFLEIKDEHTVVVSGDYYGEKAWMKEVEYTNTFLQDLVDSGHDLVIFDTLRNISGKDVKIDDASVKEIKKKHSQLFNIKIDLLIVDETHYGARGSVYGKTLGYGKGFSEAEENKEFIEDEEIDMNNEYQLVTALNAEMQLHLSGTPYKIMSTDEFRKDGCEIIGLVTYIDQLKLMRDWYENPDNHGKCEWENPLFGLPVITMLGCRLTKKCENIIRAAKKANPYINVSINEVFKCDKNGKFVHEKEVKQLFVSIFAGILDKSCHDNKDIFKHIVSVMPTVSACHNAARIVKEILGEDSTKVLVAVKGKVGGEYKKMDVECETARKLDEALIKYEKEGKKTITFTCIRLLTGTTVRAWDTMLYFRGGDSPELYDQARFRLTSSRIDEAYDPVSGKTIKVCRKHDVFFIDFQPSRMLSIRYKAIAAENLPKEDVTRRVNEELSFIPYINLDNICLEKYEYTYRDIMSAFANTDEATFADSLAYGTYKGLIYSSGFDRFNRFSADNVCDVKDKVVSPMSDDAKQHYTTTSCLVSKNVTVNEKNKADKEKELHNKVKNAILSLLFFTIGVKTVFNYGIDDLFEYILESKDEYLRLKTAYPITIEDIEWLKDNMTEEMKREFAKDCFNVTYTLNNSNVSWEDKISFIQKKCGKISSNGFAVPGWIAKKQLELVFTVFDKKGKSGNICEISSVYGEYLIEAVKMRGKEIAEKFRILPMNNMANDLINTVCNIMGVSSDIVLSDLVKDEETESIDIKLFIDENKNEKIKNTLKEMNIDAIVGNPPYQGSGQKQLYPAFYKVSKEVSDTVCLIFPKSWQEPNPRPGIGVKYMYENDVRTDKQIVCIENRSDIFPEAPGARDVNIVAWSNGYDNKLGGKQLIKKVVNGKLIEDVVDLSNQHDISAKLPKEIVNIVKAVKDFEDFSSIRDLVSKRRPYGLPTDVFTTKNDLFYDEKRDDSDVGVHGSIGRTEQKFLYTNRDNQEIHVGCNSAGIDTYKILFPCKWGNVSPDSPYMGGAFAPIRVVPPGEICTEKFQTAFPCQTANQVKKAAKYFMSRFFRALLMSLKTKQATPNEVFENIPYQDFHEDFWLSDNIDDIDNGLFEKYGISKEDREFVKNNIQPKTVDSIINFGTIE